MQFNSYSYLILLIPVVLVFWQLRPAWRNAFLLVMSILFYASWNALYTPLPIIISIGAFWCGLRIYEEPERAGFWLKIGTTGVLVCLGFFKYLRFLHENLGRLWTFTAGQPLGAFASVAVPLGISFYSFEAISYLVDIKQRREEPVRFKDLCLFIMFWPHLIAGPIVRVRELIPQLRFQRRFEPGFILLGLDRIIWGLVQKNVIVNALAFRVDNGFQSRAAMLNTTLDTWFLALAFGLEIYFDFSAYTNLAIGTAQLLGITLPDNFRYPYHARTPPEFWSRWHMTLSRWVRDYLFFPINVKYGGAALPLYASLLGIMALIGLWHGAGWGFLLWGLLQGIYLVAYRLWEKFATDRNWSARLRRPIGWIWRCLTLIAVTIAWIPFRAVSLHQTLTMWQLMFVRLRPGLSYSGTFYLTTMIIAGFCAVEPLLASKLKTSEGPETAVSPWRSYILRPALYAVGLIFFMIFDDQDTQFIYFQF